MISQPQNFKKFGGIIVYVGKNDFRARVRCGVDNAEKNRNADAVNDFGFGKIDDQRARARFQKLNAFTLNFLAGQFV